MSSRSTRTRRGSLSIWIAWTVLGATHALALPAAADDDAPSIGVNRQVTLDEHAAPDGSTRPSATGGGTDSPAASDEPREPEVATGASEETDRDQEPALHRPPASESAALGTPSGLFSIGGAGTDAASRAGVSAESTSPLGRAGEMVDPRQSEIARVVLALGAVVGLIFLTRVVLRRAAGGLGAAGAPSGVLEVLARYPVGKQQQFMLLKLARRIVLVHNHAGTMTTVTEITHPEEVAQLLARIESGSRGRDALRFKQMLRQFEHGHDQLRSPADLSNQRERPAKARRADDDAQVVDLTRSQLGGLGTLLGRRRTNA